MSASQIATFAIGAAIIGALAGAVLTPRPGARLPAETPAEQPMQVTKQARLDAGCGDRTWPYIPADCLERVGAVKRVGAAEPTVTVANRDLATRTTTLTRTPLVRTASR